MSRDDVGGFGKGSAIPPLPHMELELRFIRYAYLGGQLAFLFQNFKASHSKELCLNYHNLSSPKVCLISATHSFVYRYKTAGCYYEYGQR